MKAVRYKAEFSAEAILQVTKRGHGELVVVNRLEMSDKSLHLWIRHVKGQPDQI